MTICEERAKNNRWIQQVQGEEMRCDQCSAFRNLFLLCGHWGWPWRYRSRNPRTRGDSRRDLSTEIAGCDRIIMYEVRQHHSYVYATANTQGSW